MNGGNNPVWVKRAAPVEFGGYDRIRLSMLNGGINSSVRLIQYEQIIDLVGVMLFTSFDCNLETYLNAETECFDVNGDLVATFMEYKAAEEIKAYPEHVLYIPRWDLNRGDCIGERAVVDLACVISPYQAEKPYSIQRSITNAISYLCLNGCDTLYIPYNSTGAWGMDVQIFSFISNAIIANRKCLQRVYISVDDKERCEYMGELIAGNFTSCDIGYLEE